MTQLTENHTVAALYRFVALPEYASLKAPLLARMQELGINGTLLLACEGINGTVAGSDEAIKALISFLKADPIWQGQLAQLEVKKSFTHKKPFTRCKVKLKQEIVTMGVTGIDPNKSVGTYIKPSDWNDLISDPDVVTVDTRNDYEIQIGTFKGAVNPHTTSFREFPEYAQRELDPQKNKKVAMFCTGGIRCEKSTAYMKSLGFEDVYHLQGGILKYLEEVPQAESMWEGECFVFDERVAVDHDLERGSYTQCHACRIPLNETDLQHSHYVPGESCGYCFDKTTAEQRAGFRERQKQVNLAQQRGEEHIGGSADALGKERHAMKLAAKEKQRAGN